jgi:hypothetical protein
MRIVRHPNIVELKAFFYNNGERVRTAMAQHESYHSVTNPCITEGRGLSQPGLGVRSGDRLSRVSLLQQDENSDADS